MPENKPYPTIACGGIIRSGIIVKATAGVAEAMAAWAHHAERARTSAAYAIPNTEGHPLGRLELDGRIESFDFVDAESGELVMTWRVECRAADREQS